MASLMHTGQGQVLDKEVWKEVLDHFLRQKIKERAASQFTSGSEYETDSIDGPIAKDGDKPFACQYVDYEKQLEGDSFPLSRSEQHPQGLIVQLAPPPPPNISLQIARRLIVIADQFERERANSPTNSPSTENNAKLLGLLTANASPKNEQDMEERIIESIHSMDGPVEIPALVRMLDTLVSERTLVASLDYITNHVGGVQRVALAFDLVAAICAAKLVAGNLSTVKEIATNYLLSNNVLPSEAEMDSVLGSQDNGDNH